ncbi:Chaperone DnaJ-domain superfamily protein [Forsythia ovata]|uniref:Chaperone DnaJ-domain superfamily protein n=1 Tax=Forsythia ovata TaxID=205694 RepID=A0ABD1VIJ5_9LAMI
MEQSFFPTTTTRSEALRWLTIAEKLLSARDLLGSKSFATRARDSDPTLLAAEQILAVADALLAGDRRINNTQLDWYSILQVPHQCHDSELIANQYRRLTLLLNPQKNNFPFADQAFRIVVDAWSVLSNPSRKSVYDKELSFHLQQQPDPFNPVSAQEHLTIPSMQQNFMFFGGSSSSASPHVPQPQVHASSTSSASHIPQAQVPAHVVAPDTIPFGSSPEQVSKQPVQSFINFSSGGNIAFGSGSGSGSVSTQEQVYKQPQQNFPSFTGNVASASRSSQEQVNKQPQPEKNYSNVTDKSHKTSRDTPVDENLEEVERVDAPAGDGVSTFWTACPYCYHMYEYPRVYVDCTMRCQKCKRAFQAVAIPSPPPIADGQEQYFCCWGFLPLGVSMANLEKNRGAASQWTPFSPMFTSPQTGNATSAKNKVGRKSSAPRVYVDDDDDIVELSNSSESDDDWKNDMEKKKKKKKVNSVKGKGAGGKPNKHVKKVQVDKAKNVNVADEFVSPLEVETPNKSTGEPSKKGSATNARKQPGRVAKNFGKLDLNVEFNNEVEEPAPRVNQGNGSGRGEDDNMEGNGFFEGLDEFLSSLPILNVVGDDKVVKAA